MESHPQNPEFRNNPENFHPWILSSNQIIKALIRLCGCAGWSALLLLTNPKDRFSCVEAPLMF